MYTYRYEYGKTESKEEIEKSLEQARIEYEDLLNTPSADRDKIRARREIVFVLEELLRHADELTVSDLYDGMTATKQDGCSFIAESVPIAALMTVVLVVFAAAKLISAEFDEGVYVYIYYKSRTGHMLRRSATTLITGIAAYLWFCGFVLMISKAFPEFHSHGLVVTADRAYIIDIGNYLLCYVFARYLFVSLFASLLVILAAVVVRRSLPMYGISAGLIGAYFALKAFYPGLPAALGLCGEQYMYFSSRLYFDLTPLYLPVLAAVVVLYLKLVFERLDL
ncbi:MAG: hypothetical protein ILO53_03425 [Clostridia bacterium]|nr:hypothetical protein [Clostridia bacterium]